MIGAAVGAAMQIGGEPAWHLALAAGLAACGCFAVVVRDLPDRRKWLVLGPAMALWLAWFGYLFVEPQRLTEYRIVFFSALGGLFAGCVIALVRHARKGRATWHA